MTPAIRIVRGNPDADEIAALVVALHAAGRGAEGGAAGLSAEGGAAGRRAEGPGARASWSAPAWSPPRRVSWVER